MTKAGRPRTLESQEEFETRADAYFSDCDEKDKPYTVTGLALAVGLNSRQSLIRYEERPEFSDAIKRAKLRVECCYEMRLHGPNPTGAIFALKNFGWSDKQELKHSGDVHLTISENEAAVL